MEYCSHELSVQLRDAGFPQPDIGKVTEAYYWVFIDDKPSFVKFIATIGDTGLGEHFIFQKLDSGLWSCVLPYRVKIQAYAPTALDILKELTGQYPPIVYYSKEAGLWSCLDRDPGNLLDRELGLPPIGFADKSAVIAIAKFWLYKNKKTQRVSVVEAAKALQDSIDNLTKS